MKKNKEKAIIALYDEHKRILLQDRFGLTESEQEWGFFGGGMEEGETPEQTVMRELEEELNIHVTTFEHLIDLKEFRVDGVSYNEVHLYIGPLGNLLTYAVQREGRGMKLVTIEELKHLKLGRTDKDIAVEIERYFENDKLSYK